MNKKLSIKKLFNLILICGLFILIVAGTRNQIRSQTQPEEHSLIEPTPTPDEAIVIIKKLLEIFLTMPSITDSDSNSPPGSITGSPAGPTPDSSSPSTPRPAFTSLRDIFQEVGNQVGVPPLILEAVMQIEMPSTFNLTPDQVKEYSEAGKVIPGCGPNVCSATGPMQMTIGTDNSGSSLCPNCCWKGTCLNTKGGCPNAWSSYGSGDPCNLTDNIRAAAKKLKTDSQATSSTGWTEDQVNRAARRYYGDCTVAYARLGNKTYCGYVWWYYNTN